LVKDFGADFLPVVEIVRWTTRATNARVKRIEAEKQATIG
jgi:hypothetical protein